MVDIFRKTSNIRRTLIGNEIVDHCRRCSNYIFIVDSIPDFNGLGKDKCKTRQETVKVEYSVRLILDIWRYSPIIVMEAITEK